MPEPAAAAPVDQAQRLCTSCGLCCTGALFEWVPLEPDEVGRAEANGLAPVPGEPPRFAQPCPRLGGCICTIYRDRPRACAAYRCNLLRKLDAGDIGLTAGLAIVRKARALEADAQAVLVHANIRPALRAMEQPLDELATQLGVDRQAVAVERLRVAALQQYLERHFQTPQGPAREREMRS